MKKGKIPFIIFLGLWLTLSVFGLQEREKPNEYQLKVLFIKNIANFIQWPKGSDMFDKSQHVVFGIIGETPIRAWAEKIYHQQKSSIKGKEVKIIDIISLEEISGCHILFISRPVAKDLPKILEIIKNKPILIIGDTEGFLENGVHFNLVIKSGRVKYEINQMALKRSSLVPKYQLFKFASRVFREET